MIATAMFVSEKDPFLVVSVAKGHLTSQLIEKAGGFTVIAGSEGQKDLYKQLLKTKGTDADKFEALSISTLPGEPGKPLIPKGSAAWFECKTVAKQAVDNYIIITAHVTDFKDLRKSPLVWKKQGLFSIQPL
jgi:flavin reductase (DIM6/NTAB) family NADH-FMN oxidoreductase RutF